MQCQEVQKKLGEFLDDELPVEDKNGIERHLAFCKDCLADYQAIANLTAAAREAMTASPSAKYWESLPQRIAARISANTAKRPGWKTRLGLAKYRFAYGFVGVATVLVLLFFVGKDHLQLVRIVGTTYVPSPESPEKQTDDSADQRIVQKKELEKGHEELGSVVAKVESKDTVDQHELLAVRSLQVKRGEGHSNVGIPASKPMGAIKKGKDLQSVPPEMIAALMSVDSGSMQPRRRNDLSTNIAEVESLPLAAKVAEQQESKNLVQDREIGKGSATALTAFAKSDKAPLLETRSQLRVGQSTFSQQNRTAMSATEALELSSSRPKANGRSSLALTDTLAALQNLVEMSTKEKFAKESSENAFSQFLQNRANENIRNDNRQRAQTPSEREARNKLVSEAAELFYQVVVSESLSVMKPIALEFFQIEKDVLTAAFGKENYQQRIRQLE